MAANTKQIKYDVDKKPSPQYFDPELDEYGYLYGSNGASRHMLYGADGQPVSTTGNKLAIRASEIETLLNDIKGKDFATQTTLAAILSKIVAAPATEAKQDTIIGHVDGVEGTLTALNGKDFATQTTLAQILAKIIAAPATEAKQDTIIGHVDGVEAALATLLTKAGFDAKADITMSALRDAIRGASSKTLTDLATTLATLSNKDFATQTTLAQILAKIIAAPATEAKQTALNTLIGEVQTAPTANTLLARMKSLEDKIDAIIAGTSPAVTTLSGSKMKLYGATISDRPDATTVPIGATFTIVDASQEFNSWMSDGTSWGEEI